MTKLHHARRNAVRATALAALVAGALAGATGCAQLTLAWASLDVEGKPPARPPALGSFGSDGPVETPEDWRARRAPALREAFQQHIYGFLPDASEARVLETARLEAPEFEGIGHLEVFQVQVSATFDGEVADSEVFGIDLLLPAGASGPVPVVIMQTFCPLTDRPTKPALTGGGPGVSCNGGVLSRLTKLIFRRAIATPPLIDLLERGFGVATIYSKGIVPDKRRAGLDALDALAPQRAETDTRWGAIAAWGWLYSRMIDVVGDDPRVDPNRMIAFGHSRFGKAALFAAAFDDRIDGVISNQSGAAGAALSKGKKGETVRAITSAFPHWFATSFDEYAGREEDLPIDQHLLIALIAPRPVFLGNARRDVWSDPNGTYRAAQGATPVYELLGGAGLDQQGMADFNPNGDIAYWFRPGRHSIVRRDWPALIAFLEAHFGAGRGAGREGD